MKTIKIVIEKTSDYYDAYAENCEGIYGAGATVEETKKNISEAIELVKAGSRIPAILKDEYTITYKYDVQSFLNYYNQIFTNVALERITGINQKLLHHYASGLKKPREAQRKRIEQALHSLGNELLAVEL